MHRGLSRSDPGPIDGMRRSRPSPTQVQSRAVQLPRHLERPAFAEAPREVLHSILPELTDVPSTYIRQMLNAQCGQMLAGIRALAPAHIPRAVHIQSVPPTFPVPLSLSTEPATCPTHVLAIVSSKSAASHQALLFPVHDVAVITHFNNIRIRPYTRARSSAISLPVIRLSIPSPHAFAILHTFMYSHRLDHVLKAVLPLPDDVLQSLTSHRAVLEAKQSQAVLAKIAAHLCQLEHDDLGALMRHVAHIKDLWQDMIVTGIYMVDLWDTLDLAWDIALYALNQAKLSQNS